MREEKRESSGLHRYSAVCAHAYMCAPPYPTPPHTHTPSQQQKAVTDITPEKQHRRKKCLKTKCPKPKEKLGILCVCVGGGVVHELVRHVWRRKQSRNTSVTNHQLMVNAMQEEQPGASELPGDGPPFCTAVIDAPGRGKASCWCYGFSCLPSLLSSYI